MTEHQPEVEKLKIIASMQQSEANIHWKRNNNFLICSSILLIALSQFHQRFYQLTIAGLGFTLNIAWLLIQYRSSKYILHWKTESGKLRAQVDDLPDIFPPKLKGIEMRKVALILPIAFMVIWALIFVFLLTSKAPG